MSNESASIQNAISSLISSDSERDHIVICADINREVHYRLSNELREKARKKQCTVYLTTYGGDPDAAFRIGRCLRHYFPEDIRVVVPSYCKSAGTLIVIAANSIGIGDLGELGPLDVQVLNGAELAEQSSGLDIQEALGTVTQHVEYVFHDMLGKNRNLGLSTKLAAELAAKVSSSIAAPLLSQIDPLRLGEMQRKVNIAFEYGKRLNAYASILKPDGLDKLVQSYPTHGFVIDRKEAAEIFDCISSLSAVELTFVDQLWHIIRRPNSNIVELLQSQLASTNTEAYSSESQGTSGNESNPQQANMASHDNVSELLKFATSSGRRKNSEGARVRKNRKGNEEV